MLVFLFALHLTATGPAAASAPTAGVPTTSAPSASAPSASAPSANVSPGAGAGGPLAAAEAALAQGDVAACGALAQRALQAGTLSAPDTARAWLLRGRCFVVGGDLDRGERSYAVALRLDRQIAPWGSASSSSLSSSSGDPAFAAARAALPAAAASLAGRAAVLDPALHPGSLEVELVADDLLLVRGARVHAADGEEVARFPLEAARPRHRVSGLAGPLAGLVAVFLDKHGNELVRVPVAGLIDGHAAQVITVVPGAAAAGPSVLTTLGATALGAGIVGIVASGIGLVSLPTTAPAGDETLWLVGVGASTGLFLVGAGLVVVDQSDLWGLAGVSSSGAAAGAGAPAR